MELKVPEVVGEAVKVIVPVGVELPLPPVSATVAVHVDACFTATLEGEQTTVVLVVLKVAEREAVPLLVRWSASPP